MLLRIFGCVLFIGLEVVLGNETTLTTEKPRVTASALPTTLFRTLDDEDNDDDNDDDQNYDKDDDVDDDKDEDTARTFNDDLDDDKDEDTARRLSGMNKNNYNDIWDWDFWCQLQPKAGNCSMKVPRYYYDAQLDKCLPFTFSGCHGNKNNFGDVYDCERHCKGAAYMPIKDVQEKHFCGLQPSAGLCLALLPKFYYSLNDEKCKSFIYGGCGGNHNRFESEALCMAMCRGNQHFRRDVEHNIY